MMTGLVALFRRPPWPALFAVSAAGYLILSIAATGILSVTICGAGDEYWPAGIDLWTVAAGTLTLNSPTSLLIDWCIMLAAMMPLLLAAPIVHVRQSSLTHRRTQAVAMFSVGYAAVWLAMALPLGLIALIARMVLGPAAFAVAVAGALAWSASPVHQRLLNRAHRMRPLSVFGLRAHKDCLAFGIEHGLLCAATCWAWMMVPLLAATWQFTAMVLVGIVLFAERLSLPRPPRWRVPGAIARGLRLYSRIVSRKSVTHFG